MFPPKLRTVSQLINSSAIEIEAQLPPLEHDDWVDDQPTQILESVSSKGRSRSQVKSTKKTLMVVRR